MCVSCYHFFFIFFLSVKHTNNFTQFHLAICWLHNDKIKFSSITFGYHVDKYPSGIRHRFVYLVCNHIKSLFSSLLFFFLEEWGVPEFCCDLCRIFGEFSFVWGSCRLGLVLFYSERKLSTSGRLCFLFPYLAYSCVLGCWPLGIFCL